jgi:hypothetical protein
MTTPEELRKEIGNALRESSGYDAEEGRRCVELWLDEEKLYANLSELIFQKRREAVEEGFSRCRTVRRRTLEQAAFYSVDEIEQHVLSDMFPSV